jgi:HEAT repeat protein
MRTILRTAILIAAFGAPAAAQSVPNEVIGHRIPVPGVKVDGTTASLSEVERELVEALPPQKQAERLLQYAISHQVGATDEIKARVSRWRGLVSMSDAMSTLLDVARNGADLRVRAAAIEIELACFNIAKSTEQVDTLLERIAAHPKDSRLAIYELGLLGNRSVGVERIHAALRELAKSDEEIVRYQAYAAIANLGTDDSVPDLLAAFRFDASLMVRIDGGGCGLAHCGMLTRAQRMLAIPGLIEMVEDRNLDATLRVYGYRALREITDENLPDEPQPWREWHATKGAETLERFRRIQGPTGAIEHF